MNKKIISIVLACTLLITTSVSLSGCNLQINNSNTMTQKEIQQLTDSMSTKELIEQKLMLSFRQYQQAGETEPHDVTSISHNAELKDFLSKQNFGGVILFGSNISSGKVTSENSTSTEDLMRLISDFQQCALNQNENTKHIPMFVAADQEGGNVFRLTEGTRMPGNMAVAATNQPQNAYKEGKIIAEEMEALGFNLDFAPDLDIITNPNNSVNSVRSFGDNPTDVSKYGFEYVKSFNDTSVLETAKHFPGLGDSASDPHTSLSVVDKSWDELKNFELVPYKTLIDNKMPDMIMAAHAELPQVNPEETCTYEDQDGTHTITRPSSLSYKIMTEKLRNEMHYQGLTVTDALNMGAVTTLFTPEQAVLWAFDAGIDIALMPMEFSSSSDIQKLQEVIDKVAEEIDHPSENSPYIHLDKNQIKDSVKRILTYKNTHGILNPDIYQTDRLEKNIQYANSYVGSEENHDTEYQIASEAITVVENKKTEDRYALPFQTNNTDVKHVLLIGTSSSVSNTMQHHVEDLKDDEKLPSSLSVDTITYTAATAQLSEEDIKKIQQADQIILTTSMGTTDSLKPSHPRTAFPKAVQQLASSLGKADRLAIISVGMPFDLGNYTDASALLISYGAAGEDPTQAANENASIGQNVSAAIDVIYGFVSPQGQLPIEIKQTEYDPETDLIHLDQLKYPRGFGMKEIKISHKATVQTNKKYDGLTDAKVENIGKYTGISKNDDVKVEVTATYDNNSIGKNKKIFIHYSLTGKDANKYYLNAPLTDVIENAEITS